MFDKAKKMWQLQKKARTLQGELRNLKIEAEELGGKVRVAVNGEQKVQEIYIDDSLLVPQEKDALLRALTNAFNGASTKAQQAAARKVKELGGLGDLSGVM